MCYIMKCEWLKNESNYFVTCKYFRLILQPLQTVTVTVDEPSGETSFSLLCLLPLRRKSELPSSATVSSLSLISTNANPHITPKTFTLTYRSTYKSKSNTHPRNVVIIKIIQKRSSIM